MLWVIANALCIICLQSCSGGDPVKVDAILPGIQEQSAERGESNHYLWAYNLVYVNPSENEFEIIPVRQVAIHWNIVIFLEQTPCANCLKIIGITPSWSGTSLVTIMLTHPFDNPNLTGFDVRGITMFSGSFSFPNAGLNTPDRFLGDGELVNADGYTTLYNFTTAGSGLAGLQGYIKGNLATATPPDALLNGYKRLISGGNENTRNAFFTDYEKMFTFDIDMPDGPFVLGYAVDVSWAPPINKPVEDPMTDFGPNANCPEPWKIEVVDIGPGLAPEGGTTILQIDVYDWQGKDDAHPVIVECPELFDGEIEGTWVSDEDGFTRYEAEIENAKLAPMGDYHCLVSKEAKENDPINKPWLDLTAYLVFPAKVGWLEGFPVDVTPPLLNFSSNLVVVDGDYGYIARGDLGLHIYDLSDPVNPVLINMFDTPGSANKVVLSGGYAYVADGDSGLQIIDISTPESAFTVSSVVTPGSAETFVLSGSYAYVLDENLQVIDIDPPELAYLVNSVATPGSATKVEVSGGYAYVSDGDLQIIDIDPPESASIVNFIEPYFYFEGFTVSGDYVYIQSHSKIQDYSCSLQIFDIQTPESANEVKNDVQGGRFESEITVSGGYAYVGQEFFGLRIIDIDPPESACTVGSVVLSTYAISLSGNLAYVISSNGLCVINIELPESPYLVSSVDTPGTCGGITLFEDYAYINNTTGIQIISIEPPESAYFASSIENVFHVDVLSESEDYMYVIGSGGVFQIIDIDPPESAYVLKTLDIEYDALGVVVTGDYAYFTNSFGLHIIDINPPESAYIVNSVDTPGYPMDLVVAGNYAYIADSDSGLQIIDIDPPESAYILNTVETPESARGVAVSGDYAYILESVGLHPELNIVDINPPESAYIIKSVEVWWYSSAVEVSGGYAYVTDGNPFTNGGSIKIIDVDPPESAHIISSVTIPYDGYGFAISGGYAYIACHYSYIDHYSELAIVDIDPPFSAHHVSSFDTGMYVESVAVSEGYVYVGCQVTGLSILKLW